MLRFDATAFGRAEFEPRTQELDIPKGLLGYVQNTDLDDNSGTTPRWTVRAMTGPEVNTAEDRASGVITQIATQLAGMMAEGAKAPDTGTASPGRAKLLYVLQTCSVSPGLDHTSAMMVADHFPVFALSLQRVAYDLTGMGSVPGKLRPSTEATT